MPGVPEPDTRAVPRAPRRTIRTRLTVTYTLLVLAVAGLLIAGIYAFMRYAPTYDFTPVPSPGAATLTPVPGAKPTPVSLLTALPPTFPAPPLTTPLPTLLLPSL